MSVDAEQGLLDLHSLTSYAWRVNTVQKAIGESLAVGVITHPNRKDSLQRTLASLRSAGVSSCSVFVDHGYELVSPNERKSVFYGVHLNYMHALTTLYTTQSRRAWYAIFQDDVEVWEGSLAYFLLQEKPPCGYFNLISLLENDVASAPIGWRPIFSMKNGYQVGRGAVALIFPETLVSVLVREVWVPLTLCVRGGKGMDGVIVEIANDFGFQEYVHFPSLCQHHGEQSLLKHQFLKSSSYVKDLIKHDE